MGQLGGKRGARGRGLDAVLRDDGERVERERVGDAPRLPALALLPREHGAAEEAGREVVRVRLELHREREQLVRIRLPALPARRGGEAERDRRRRGAEPARERDPVAEGEALPRDRLEQREGLQAEVRLVERRLLRAFALDLDLERVRRPRP